MNIVMVQQKKTSLIFLKTGFLKTKTMKERKKKDKRERDRETEREKLAKTFEMLEVCINLIGSTIMKDYGLHHPKIMIYFLIILETKLPRQRWQQNWFLLERVFSACRWLYPSTPSQGPSSMHTGPSLFPCIPIFPSHHDVNLYHNINVT